MQSEPQDGRPGGLVHASLSTGFPLQESQDPVRIIIRTYMHKYKHEEYVWIYRQINKQNGHRNLHVLWPTVLAPLRMSATNYLDRRGQRSASRVNLVLRPSLPP